MDNKRSPKETRVRRDTMSASERQSLGKGYPVRPDADRQNYRAVNYRPRADGGNIPDYMRRGEAPIRKNAAERQSTPQKVLSEPAVEKNAATMTVSREALRTQMAKSHGEHDADGMDALEATRTISREQLRDADKNGTWKNAPPQGSTAKRNKPKSGKPSQTTEESTKSQTARRIPVIPLVVVLVAAVVLAIVLPTALHKDKTPGDVDYDMAQGFAPDALTVTDQPQDTTSDTTDTDDTSAPANTTETESETAPTEGKFSVTLTFFDRDPITVSTGKITLGALLEKVGYTVRDTDKFPLDLTAELTEDATIAVDTVTYDTVTTTESIPYTAKTTEVQTIPRGTKEIAQYGQNGEKTITYTVTYCNGEEIAREKSGESITKYPVEEISTVGVGGTLVGADGNTYSYSYYKVCNATYYDIEGITYLGYNADESVVATDKSCIPMGTKLYVKNDTFDFGVRTAADTGSMIQGWEVDIWLSDSNPQKAAFAKGGYWSDMRVYFLD